MNYDLTEMFRIAVAARQHAYAPYSEFKVGSCIATAEGHYYGGCNVENSSYPMTQCAEASSIGNMIVSGSKEIIATLVVTDTEQGVFPCGGCLQKLSEFIGPEADVISANLAGAFTFKKFRELFSTPFKKALA